MSKELGDKIEAARQDFLRGYGSEAEQRLTRLLWDNKIAIVDALRAYAPATREPVTPTVKACAEFIKWALQEGSWEGGDLDGGSIQDKAEALGLVVKVEFDPAKHDDIMGGGEIGDPWFVFSDGLKTLAAGQQSAASTVEPVADLKQVFDRKFKFFEEWAAEPTLREIVVEHYMLAADTSEDKAKDLAGQYLDGLASLYTAPTTSPNPVVADYATTEATEPDAVREAARRVIEANSEFRAGLPAEWEGDALSDACNDLEVALSRPSHGDDLAKAAQAVIDRWETPAWKDAPATAVYINALRDALARNQGEGGWPRS